MDRHIWRFDFGLDGEIRDDKRFCCLNCRLTTKNPEKNSHGCSNSGAFINKVRNFKTHEFTCIESKIPYEGPEFVIGKLTKFFICVICRQATHDIRQHRFPDLFSLSQTNKLWAYKMVEHCRTKVEMTYIPCSEYLVRDVLNQ